jgi:hypothetical protein
MSSSQIQMFKHLFEVNDLKLVSISEQHICAEMLILLAEAGPSME